jgi:PAS domain S-box-containing protein
MLAALVRAAPDAMLVCDGAEKIRAWNRGAEELFGLEADELPGLDFLTLIDAPEQEQVRVLFEVALRGESSGIFRTTGLHKDGQLVDLSLRFAPIETKPSDPARVGIVARDVSERRRMEEQAQRQREQLEERETALRDALTSLRKSHEELKQAQLQIIHSAKLESIGRLAAGVAHEVKNPLAIILAGTEFLAGHPDAEQVQSVLEDIRAAVKRANGVIGGLLDFSSATEIQPSMVPVNQVVEQSLGLVQHALVRERVQVVRDLAPDLPAIPLDVTKIEQVLVNLCINAIDAMGSGGTLTVRTRMRQLRSGDEGIGLRQSDPLRVGQTAVLIEIQDSGPGLPPDHLAKVFDPFFTTKPTGKGTGLGLAVSRTIVGIHGGAIWLQNAPAGGAIATVVLRCSVP